MSKGKKQKGAISVFLSIILVPCIVVSSVFVDLSRVHLSKTTAESAADLALNSLLTNYDADLKDWYGMVASCQNIDDFYEASAGYFLRMLSSQGMSDEEILLLSDYYADATNDDTIYDLLKVECNTQSSGMITPVDGANLSNAAMIKEQVVEFMKYRAPIEIATNLVDRLTRDSTVKGALEADENEPLVKDKEAFYKSEGDLVEAAFYTYQAIKAYYLAVNKDGFTNDSLAAQYTVLGGYQNAYKEITGYVISNLTNTSGLQRYSRVTITKTYYNEQYTNPERSFSEVYSEKVREDESDVYYIDLEDVEDLVKDLQKKIQEFNTAKSNFSTAAQPILKKLPYGTESSQTNPIQWWVQMNHAVNASTGTNHTAQVESAAQEMMRAYSRVLAIDECELRGTLPTGWASLDDWKTKYNGTSLISQAESLQATYLTSGVSNDNDLYLKAVKNLESVSSSQYGNINAANLYVSINGNRVNLNSALSLISAQLTSAKQQIKGYVDLLNVAIDGDGDGDDTPSLDELQSYVETYEKKLQEWTDTADGLDTTMAGEDQKEILDREEAVEISQQDLTILKTRLVNIRSQFQEIIDAVDTLKWGGEAIAGITSLETFKVKAGVNVDRIGTTNGELTSYADALFGEKFAPKSLPNMEHKGDSKYDVSIDPVSENVDTPDLWIYLYKKYRASESGMEQAKQEKEDAKNMSDKKASDTKNKDRYSGGGKKVPWEYSNSATYNMGSSLEGIVGVIESLVSGDFTGMRDDLYATTYIMEMFSYATYQNEGLYNLLTEKDPNKITQLKLSNYDTVHYPTVMGDSEKDAHTWLSADPKDVYNKSLTNHLINKTNNAAYEAEVEYILCGGKDSTNKDNVKKVYENIYVLRYGLNLVSGFQHFWALDPMTAGSKSPTASAIYYAALGVNGATAGIIPIPVTEAVLIPILTIFETSKDLERLEAGFPVELYKSESEHWWLSIDPTQTAKGIGAFMTALATGDLFDRTNTGNGLFYSDYLTLFVYLGLNGDAEEGMYQRMAEVIQLNIGTMAKKTDYSLKKSQLYFQLRAELRVSPLMITLPIFNQDEYDNQMTTKTDWCTYDITTVRGY